ncbi:MAG: pyrroline-5-carboxylate reductase, partial [Oscillospiraceae bacterium]|nr:pyrroline-5-carboxylate reductase [Oscillospiraceae bacterium]
TGVATKVYEERCGPGCKVVRIMPNTPMLVGEGMAVYCAGRFVTEGELDSVRGLLECCGKAERLPERLMDQVVAVTASSPAYVFVMIEAMADAAVRMGIGRDLSLRLAAQSVLGSARMALEAGRHPAELKDMVCSPAGTTIEAIASLERNGFRGILMEAMDACAKRAGELGKEG